MSIPADAKIITDGIVKSKTIKTNFFFTGHEASSELLSFEVIPQYGKTKVKSVRLEYIKKTK